MSNTTAEVLLCVLTLAVWDCAEWAPWAAL